MAIDPTALENIDGLRFIENKSDVKKPTKEMDKDAFLQLLVAQMKNQDPSSPMDNNQFINQSAAFSSLEQLINLSEKLDSLNKLVENLSNNNQLLTASNFIGKDVKYLGNYTYFDGKEAGISFEVDSKPSKVDVSIIDGNGQVVTKLTSSKAVSGKNKIIWDGKTFDGQKVPEGTYSFQVDAYNEAGNPITVNNYSEGTVKGVTNDAGQIKFNVNGSMVGMDQILSVNETSNDK
jgi:flagellar basal-body rod modification protein FlgD